MPCFWNSRKGHLIIDYQMIYPISRIQIDTKNHGKSHFNPTLGKFLFSKCMTIKGLYISNNVCWVFDQKAWFSKDFQKRTSLISFQQTRLWIDMIFEIWELIPEQERFSNKKNIIRVGKILDINDIDTSQHSLKRWATNVI